MADNGCSATAGANGSDLDNLRPPGLHARRPEPVFFRRPDALSEEQALYYKDLLLRTAKVGTEIEFALPKGVVAEDFVPRVEATLKPSRSLADLGDHGVLDVCKEHCGVEIRIIGRYPYWDALINQYRKIIGDLLPMGIRARATCGLHFHLLTIWSQQTIPEIILANVWNLVRRYAPYLKFITSGGATREGLCRRRQHNSHLEFVNQSPLNKSMREIQQSLKESDLVPFHQNFLNLENVLFDDDGSVAMFHLEFRFPDVDMCPTSIVAKTFLFQAIMLRAVECSKYGLIHAGKIDEQRRQKELLSNLSNNDGNLATSGTSMLTDSDLDELRAGCHGMLDFLRPVMMRFENPAELILRALADEPNSLRQARGCGWADIERDLGRAADEFSARLNSIDHKLVRLIDLGEISGRRNREDWINHAADALWLMRDDVERRLGRLARRQPTWDAGLGTFLFLK